MVDDSNITQALPDYLVERELGKGGMGLVFLGRHVRLGRLVAIKELPPTFATDPSVRERFSTEARTLATLSHPHIVPIYDYVERDGLCLIVMEELPGGTVWDRFTSTGLTPPTACAVVLACCAALQHAHDKGVLHLDVKPDNLMFARDEAVKVTDFGISRVLSGDHTLGTLDGQVLGTPAYMSPEQARGSDLTSASDVYSAGIMLYELLSGHLPWTDAESATDLLLKRLREAPRPLAAIAPHVPQELADVVMKSIELETDKRYTSAEDFGVAIATACANAWGPSWLDFAGVTVIGSDRLSLAARSTRSQSPVSDAARTSGPTTAATGTASETIIGTPIASEGKIAPETTTTPSPGAPADARTTGADVPPAQVAPEPAAPPMMPPAFPVMRAAGSGARLEGANLNELDRSAFVDVSEALGRPHQAGRVFALAGVLAIAAVIAAAMLFGPPDRSGTLRGADVTLAGIPIARTDPTLDFSKDIPIRVRNAALAARATHATLELSSAGLPLGKVSAPLLGGIGTFKPGVTRYVGAGSVTGRFTLESGSPAKQVANETFPMTADNKWYVTAFGLGSVIVILAGFAYFESALRPLRRGRRRVTSFVMCGVTAAVMALGAGMLASAVGLAYATVPGIVAAALVAAAAGVACGAGVLRFALRRGVKRAVKRAETAVAATR
jgi:serine/threonine protein kinase